MRVQVIAEKYHVHRATIPKLVRRAGADVRSVGLSSEGRERASSLYKSGMTLEQIARHLGIGDEAVRQAVVGKGGTVRRRGRRPGTSVDSPS